MQRTNTQHADQVSRLFGPDAHLTQTIGTQRRPGRLEIRIGHRLIGVGKTLDQALEMAQKLLAVDCEMLPTPTGAGPFSTLPR